MELQKLTEEELKSLQKDIEAEISRRTFEDDKALADEAFETGDEGIRALAEAMMHKFHRVKPTIDRIGYYLARTKVAYVAFQSGSVFGEQKLKDLQKRILFRFDTINYIFSQTHYDECSNGFFYRR